MYIGQISIEETAIEEILNNPILNMLSLLIFIYYKVFLLYKNEATPGKNWSKLKVVQYSGERITGVKAAIREIFQILYFIPLIGWLFYLISVVLVLFTKERRSLHDRVSGTWVVQNYS